jgi:hypothetical protein
MPHFLVPSGTYSVKSGNPFKWDTIDGPGAMTQYKFQVGKTAGAYDIFNGPWKAGGAAGQWTEPVTGLSGDGSLLWVRALYIKAGQLYYTTPASFYCDP